MCLARKRLGVGPRSTLATVAWARPWGIAGADPLTSIVEYGRLILKALGLFTMAEHTPSVQLASPSPAEPEPIDSFS